MMFYSLGWLFILDLHAKSQIDPNSRSGDPGNVQGEVSRFVCSFRGSTHTRLVGSSSFSLLAPQDLVRSENDVLLPWLAIYSGPSCQISDRSEFPFRS